MQTASAGHICCRLPLENKNRSVGTDGALRAMLASASAFRALIVGDASVHAAQNIGVVLPCLDWIREV
jgi:hypothetical protein